MFNSDNPTHLAELKAEVTNDPNGYGYNPSDTNGGVLEPINQKRVELTATKPKISALAVKNLIYFEAYDNLLSDKQEWIRWVTEGADEQENLLVTQDTRDRLTGVLGGSATGDSIWAAADDDIMEPAMLALIDVAGSRAEDLWGYGSQITRSDWIAAGAV